MTRASTPAAREAAERASYTRAGRALYYWIRDAVPRLPLDAFGSDALGLSVRRSTERAVAELRTNYYRARELYTAGSRASAARLMSDSAVIAVRLEQDLRTHASRIPAIARWLADPTVSALTSSLRAGANAALEPLVELGKGFGQGAGVALGALALLALIAARRG